MVKEYKYTFTPVLATSIKIKLKNSDENIEGRKTCIGITEVELKEAKGSFTTNTTTNIASLKVNGKELSKDELTADSYTIKEPVANVEVVAADNAAITVLPSHENVVRIITESEDHNTRRVFEIKFNKEVELPAESSVLDYPAEKMIITTGSEHKATVANAIEGAKELVIDDNIKTHWHTEWGTNAGRYEDLWIAFELEKPTMLDALRYYPRTTNGYNGGITEYLVEYSMDGVKWETISKGNWNPRKAEWMIAKFDKTVEAKYVRLKGIHTIADSGNDRFMSAAEIRLRMAK